MKTLISFAPYRILSGNQIKKDEMGRASSRHEEVKIHKTLQWNILKEGDYLGNLDTEDTVILKCIL
jgi:hypothetical protein